jgi:dihydroneopterin aldolase
MVSLNYRDSIKIIEAVFEEMATLLLEAHLKELLELEVKKKVFKNIFRVQWGPKT